MNTMGVNTSTVVNVDARTAGQTCWAPSTAARMRSTPLRRSCSMLSSTTMALSSVMPMAKATPAKEMTLMLRPVASRPMKAAMVQSGMPMTPISVARDERRKPNMIAAASTAPMARLRQTVAMDCST